MTASRVRIAIRDLAKTFREGPREVAAVAGVSLDVREGEFVALVGPSGCGKSTVLNMIGALVAPSAGEVLVDGEPVKERAPRQVGYVFQRPEMHRIHHEYGRHRNNYGDFVWWDMLFGTYENPPTFTSTCGFDDAREQMLLPMLAFQDVHREGR